jgi:hypothetical protein
MEENIFPEPLLSKTEVVMAAPVVSNADKTADAK